MLHAITILSAKPNKGEQLWKQAQQAEQSKDYVKALDLYALALKQDPTNAGYVMGERRVRFELSLLLVETAQKKRESKQLAEAASDFQKAYLVDPSNTLALQEYQRTMAMLERVQNGTASVGHENETPADTERRRSADRIASMQPPPELKPLMGSISTLKMNNQPAKILYETVAKLSGVNVIYDPLLVSSGRNFSLDLNHATLREALDYVALLTHTFWKPITANTIFVTEDSLAKRRDFEEEVVKVFYLKNISSVQEFQEVVTAVRSAADIRRMFTYAAEYAVVARGTVDQIALAEKLFHDLDLGKAEVAVDIMVLEVNSSHTRDLAAGLVSSSGTVGLNIPISFSPRNPLTTTSTTTTSSTSSSSTSTSTTAASQISLGQIGKLGFSDFGISLPSALLQAIASDSSTRIVQSPKVRAADGQKVVLKIGDKIPYATGSYQAGTTVSTTVSALVSTQFNYAEVGVNVELTPHVTGNEEISMHVGVEISSVSRYVDVGGLSQPVISQRKEEAEVRMKNGEVNLLGGLTQLQDTKSLSGIPGLVNLPVLGRAFGSSSNDKDRGELLIALVPHIVRKAEAASLDSRSISIGTDQVVKINYSQPAETPEIPASTVPPETPPQRGSVAFDASKITATVGQKVPVSLSVGVKGKVHVAWDPSLLRLDSLSAGEQKLTAMEIRNEFGESTFATEAQPSKITLTFISLAAGQTNISATLAGGSPAVLTVSSK